MKKWIQKNGIALSLLLVIAVMVMIFCFSAQTGEESGAMSNGITKWLLTLLVPDFESMSADEQIKLFHTVGLVIRKGAHFSEYALLGLSLMLHIRQVKKKKNVSLPWLWAWGIGTLYAATDEFHQGFVADRGPSIIDVMIDSSGVITGVLLMMWLLRKRK